MLSKEAVFVIETDRLVLRTWKESDIEPFYAINQDDKVFEFLINRMTAIEEVQKAFIARNTMFTEKGYCRFAAELKSTGQLIGLIGISDVSFQAHFTPAVGIGWRLGSQYWRNGYATEGAQAVIDYAFKVVGLDEIVGFTTPTNHKSIRIMEKLGMTFDHEDDFFYPFVSSDNSLGAQRLYKIQNPLKKY